MYSIKLEALRVLPSSPRSPHKHLVLRIWTTWWDNLESSRVWCLIRMQEVNFRPNWWMKPKNLWQSTTWREMTLTWVLYSSKVFITVLISGREQVKMTVYLCSQRCVWMWYSRIYLWNVPVLWTTKQIWARWRSMTRVRWWPHWIRLNRCTVTQWYTCKIQKRWRTATT